VELAHQRNAASLDQLVDRGFARQARQEDHPVAQPRCLLHDGIVERHAVQFRHHDVADHRIHDITALQDVEPFGATRRLDDVHAPQFEVPAHGAPHRGFVSNDENGGHATILPIQPPPSSHHPFDRRLGERLPFRP
jgi:hypothetical protein